jgi:cell division control protein 24
MSPDLLNHAQTLTTGQDLAKKTDNEEVKSELLAGCDAAERVLHKANDAVNRDLLDEALEELIVRVDDWKNHKVEQFGSLLLHGVYGVVTGKSDQEKDVSSAFESEGKRFC